MGQQCFLSLKNQKKPLLRFHKIPQTSSKNEDPKNGKFVMLNSPDNEYSKFATKNDMLWQLIKKWLLAWRSNKVFTKSIESSLCDYSDAYILVTGNITVTQTVAVPAGSPTGTQPQRKQPLNAATQVAFKNCALFKNCRTEINDTFVDYADFSNIAMSM